MNFKCLKQEIVDVWGGTRKSPQNKSWLETTRKSLARLLFDVFAFNRLFIRIKYRGALSTTSNFPFFLISAVLNFVFARNNEMSFHASKLQKMSLIKLFYQLLCVCVYSCWMVVLFVTFDTNLIQIDFNLCWKIAIPSANAAHSWAGE